MFVLMLLTGLLIGCGDAGHEPKTQAREEAHTGEAMSEQEREAEERKHIPGKRLSPRDRVAYYQIATTSGLLRARASTLLSGLRGTPRGTLDAGRARLVRLNPESATLMGLRDRLRAAVDALLEDEDRASANAAMKATDRIIVALNRYSKGKAVRLLVPD
jgi:hypothetical protein